ncbi:MAG: helix-turn-helix domain-containing protein [bacterium]
MNCLADLATQAQRQVECAATRRATPSPCVVPRGQLVALITDPGERRYVLRMAGSHTKVVFASSLADVLAYLRGSAVPPIAVILEARDAMGRPTAGLVRQIVRLFPNIPVVGFCFANTTQSKDILALASAGAHELLFKGQDDSQSALLATLTAARQACAADLVYGSVSQFVPEGVHALVRHCLAYPRTSRTVNDVARAMGVHRKTLVNQCAAAHCPAPGTLIAWCQLLLAAQFLGAPGVTVEAIAHELDFPSATSLRNMLKRHTQLCPRQVRDGAGLQALVDLFRATLALGQRPPSSQMVG